MGAYDSLLREFRTGLDVVRAGHLETPPRDKPLKRFFHGAASTVGVLRVLWQHPETRKRYLSIVMPQLLVILALVWLFGPTLNALPEHVDTGEGTARFKLNIDKAHEFWGLLYGAWCMAEWAVIALCRDYHDEISRRASLLLGVPPEDAPEEPKIHFSVGWAWRKLKRRIHGALIFGMGVPVAGLLTFIPEIGDGLYTVTLAAWAAYWLGVFTLGKTAFAWADQGLGEPWFFRGVDAAQKEVPLLTRGPFRWWMRLWRRVVGVVTRPAMLVEKLPYETAGLVVVRLLCSLPMVYLFIRPLVPVAGTYLLREQKLLASPTPQPAQILLAEPQR